LLVSLVRKFHDIQPNRPRNKVEGSIKKPDPKVKPQARSDIFWSEEENSRYEEIRKPKKDYSKFKKSLYKGVAVVVVLTAFFGFSFAKAVSDKDEFEINAKEMKTILNNALDDVSNGDLKSAMQKQNEAYEKMQTMKLYLDGWGQNSMYLSMIGDNRSKFINMEKLLTGASGILEASVSLEENLGGVLEDNNQDDQIVDFSSIITSLNISILDSLKKLEEAENKLHEVNTKVLTDYEDNIDQAIKVSELTHKSLEGLKVVIEEDLIW